MLMEVSRWPGAVLPLAHLWAQFLLQTRLLATTMGNPFQGSKRGALYHSSGMEVGEERTVSVPTLTVPGGSVVLLAGTLGDLRSSSRDQHVLQGGHRGGCVGGAVAHNQRPLLLPSATGQQAYWGWVGTSRVAEAVWTAACA